MRAIRGAVITAATMIMLTACGGGESDEFANTCHDDPDQAKCDEDTAPAAAETTPLEDAAEACGDQKVGNPLDKANQEPASNYITVEDDGRTLIVGGGDQFYTGPAGFCLLDELAAPASTRSKVEGTTSLMGRLTDEFGDYELTWSFHPDNGLDMIIETTS